MPENARRPRFTKTKNIPHFQLTQRDAEIIMHVFKHRFLNSTQLLRVVKGGSRQGILRRLQLLYHHGYLGRPRAQIDYFYRSGSRPIVYELGSRGAKLLIEKFSIPKHAIEWVARKCPQKIYLEHTLKTADFMIRLGNSVRTVLPPEKRVRWNVQVQHDGNSHRLPVQPDAVFSVETPGKEMIHYCLEVDCGSMPVARHGLVKTSLRRKFFAYHASWQQGRVKEKFGWNRFRVLILTVSQKRIESMQRAARELPSGHGLFLFGTHEQLQAIEDAIALPWQSVGGQTNVLLQE